ncbi:MAG: DUF748 domain-containing protein [Planctomycetota bacterium]|nr:DUF748 domain-containing protein [Planctomycetota bacterium]
MSRAANPRRTRWALFCLRTALVLVAGRLLLAAIVPFAVERVGRAYGFDVAWSRFRVHYLRGALELDGLSVAVRSAEGEPAKAPWLRVEGARVDLALLDLLRGDLRVQRAEFSGTDLVLERRADRSMPLLAAIEAALASETPKEPERPKPISFAPPVRVDALRVESLRVHVRDEVAWTGHPWQFDVDVHGGDLGYTDRRGHIDVLASGPELVDAVRVEIDIETRADDAAIDVQAHMGGLRTWTVVPWLAELAANPGITGDPRFTRLDADARVEARLRVDGSARDGIAGSIEVLGLNVSTDGASAGRLARASLEVKSLRSTGLHVGSVELETGAVSARRTVQGDLCAFGFALRADAAPANAAPTGRAASTALPFDVAVDSLQARSLLAMFRDEVYEPAVEIGAVLDKASATGFDTRAASDAPIRVDAEGSVGGVAAKLRAHGVASIFSARKGIELELVASGLRPTVLAPYLSELGIESTLNDGELSAKLLGSGNATATGGVEGDLRLVDVKLVDEKQLFGVRAIEALGLSLEPATATLRVRDLTVRGTHVPLERAADGSYAGLGLHTIEKRSLRRAIPEAIPTSVPAIPAPPRTSPPRDLPRIEIDRLAVVENRLSWRDDRLAKPVDVVFDDCGLEIANLALFGDPARHERSTAKVKVWSRAQDVVKDVAVTGTVTTKPGPLDLAVELSGKVSGITAVRLQPYIDPTGLQEQLQEAALSGAMRLRLAQADGGLRADLELRDVEFTNADASVTGAKLVRFQDVFLGSERLEVASVEVVDGRLHVSRDPVGALLALGLRIPLSVLQKAESTSAEPADVPSGSKAERFLALLPDVRVGAVRVTNAQLAWRDQSFTPPLETNGRLDFSLDGFSTRSADPASYAVVVAIGDTAEEIRVQGRVNVAPGSARITVQASAKGVRGGSLVAYLPKGVVCELRSGELSGLGTMEVSEVESGGLKLLLSAENVRVAEAGEERPLLGLDDLHVVVRRADPAAQVFEFERVTAHVLGADVHRDQAGRIHAAGFAFGPTAPAAVAASGTESPAPRRSFPDLTPPGSPRVVLSQLDLALRGLTFRDDARGTQPIEIEGRLSTPSSQTLVDVDPETLPPVRLSFEAAVKPFARRLAAEVSLSPWAPEPKIGIAFEAEGISGAGLDSLGHEFSTWIDGTGLQEGVAQGSMQATLRWKRRSPLDLDFRGGVAADVELGRLEYRDAPGGRVLLALDGASAEITRIDPATGSVHAKSLELRKPEMRAKRTKDGGFEVLGLVVHPEKRPQPASASPAPAADGESRATQPVTVAAAPAPSTRPEFRIDELVVRGIDVELRDEAATPPTVLPLVDLDVLVQRFTTRAFEEPRVIRFDAWLGAGEADIQRTEHASNLLSGIATAVGDVIEGKEEKSTFEKRRIFQEAALTGRIQFVPELTGHAQATLSGLELLGFTGTAKHEGVDIGDGTLDASVRMRFRGAEGLRIDSELVFSDLSLQEPKSGPIETYLTLPVTLDTVLFLLKNADGEHRIPIGFTLDEEGLTTAKITTAAAGAAASVLATAIASAPLRVLSTFTDLFGITGGTAKPPPGARLLFAAGATELSTESRRALEPLLQKLRADADYVVQVQHRLGAGDVARAEMLANPSPEDCREIAAGLRRRRAELTRERAELAADLRATWGAGELSAAEQATPLLRAIDAEAGNVEDALDHILELLKPGAERQRGKRTRAAALAVARQRIEVLRAWFESQGIRDLERRFEAKSPAFEVDPSAEAGSMQVVLRERQ